MIRRCALVWSVASAILGVGCSSTSVTGPAFIAIERPSYAQAFDATLEIVAHEGMPAQVEDRDAGLIETRPKASGSLIEPWSWPSGSVASATDATISFQRRRARFEFLPVGFRPNLITDEEALMGRRTPGTVAADAGNAVDLRTYDGPIEVRVSVFIERAFTPGLQRSTWSLSESSVYTDPLRPQRMSVGTVYDRSVWTAIERDHEMERYLLAKLEASLAAASTTVHADLNPRVNDPIENVDEQVEQNQHR